MGTKQLTRVCLNYFTLTSLPNHPANSDKYFFMEEHSQTAKARLQYDIKMITQMVGKHSSTAEFIADYSIFYYWVYKNHFREGKCTKLTV